MQGESPIKASTPTGAVFLSYASQDAESARRICDALRAAGIEVWFDQSELRGGDVWDRMIRQRIRDCALFIPLISRHTQERLEGYFRLEWRLAVDRSQRMAAERTFILPVVVDSTRDRDALVPDYFHELQLTRLAGGEAPPAFVERIRRLLTPEASPSNAVGSTSGPTPAPLVRRSSLLKATMWSAAGILVLACAYLAADKLWLSTRSTTPTEQAALTSQRSAPPAAAAVAFNPPPHSIAVLPFVNMSGDKEQEYFSDGLTEELLNSLAEINQLQVAARTSSFSFKGKDIDIGTIARKLNVRAVLEGSVRRSGNTVRITTQLINAGTGFHLWSHTYDRDLGDVLKLETEIAGAVASALKVSLLGDEAAKIELGGTRNPAAFDAYLRARKAHLAAHGNQDQQTAIDAYTEAIGLDPNYALAFANRSLALSEYAGDASGPAIRESFDKAHADAQKAIALAPDLAEGHMALAFYFEVGTLDFTRANEEYERTLALAPGNTRVLQLSGRFAFIMGRTEAGIAALRRAVVLDPLNRDSRRSLGRVLYFGRQNKEAVAALEDALALDPEDPMAYAFRGATYYALSDLERARASCESKPGDWRDQWCLAITYNKLGRHADAEAELAKMKAALGDAAAYQYVTIYAQWGNVPKALEWLDTAVRLRDPGLELLKTDPILDPLRQEPRFQAVLRELKFPG